MKVKNMINKFFKIKFIFVYCLVFVFFNNSSMADSNYIKLNYGITSNEIGASAVGASTIVNDEDDEGFILSAGRLVGDTWGIDFMYYDLGSSSIKVDANEVFSFGGNNYIASSGGTISNDISGYGGGLYISSSSGEEFLSFSGTFRIGIHAWDKSGSTSILDNSNAFSADFYNDGVGAYAGFGLSLGLTENLAADISYDIIGVNNIVSFENGSSIASIGLKYNF